MEHAVFTLIILGIALLMKVAKNAGTTSSPPLTPGNTSTRAPGETEEERMRRFMEAVGLPPGATPPPQQVRPRPASPSTALPTIKPPILLPNTPGRLRRVPFPPGTPLVPRPAGPAQTPPPLRRVPTVPEPLTAPAVMEPVAEEVPPMRRPLASMPEEAAPGVPAIGRAAVTEAKPLAIPATALMKRLRDPAAVREAIILREVLGPPKALRPPGQLGLVIDLPPLAAV